MWMVRLQHRRLCHRALRGGIAVEATRIGTRLPLVFTHWRGLCADPAKSGVAETIDAEATAAEGVRAVRNAFLPGLGDEPLSLYFSGGKGLLKEREGKVVDIRASGPKRCIDTLELAQ
jgi:hypothetical protein